MLELRNRELRIEVLDPVADAARLGPRFCGGGYLWQAWDAAAGPLFSGPEWPAPEPSAFNGQGAPESFRHRTLEGRPLTWRGERGVALGAGELRLDARGDVVLEGPCRWEIATQPDRLTFTTRHAAAGFSYELSRTIELRGRELRSLTRLTHTGRDERLALEWFAHPFFALVDGQIRARLPPGATLAENPGFALDDDMLVQRRRFLHSHDGHMERSLRLPPNLPLNAGIAHPTIQTVTFLTSFASDAFVVWGNDRTFSLEPYLTLDLAPGETRHWSLCYRFGEKTPSSSGIPRPPA